MVLGVRWEGNHKKKLKKFSPALILCSVFVPSNCPCCFLLELTLHVRTSHLDVLDFSLNVSHSLHHMSVRNVLQWHRLDCCCAVSARVDMSDLGLECECAVSARSVLPRGRLNCSCMVSARVDMSDLGLECECAVSARSVLPRGRPGDGCVVSVGLVQPVARLDVVLAVRLGLVGVA